MGKRGQNRRRYRAIARTEQAAVLHERLAADWRDDGNTWMAALHGRIAAEQRQQIDTLERRVDYGDPRIHR